MAIGIGRPPHADRELASRVHHRRAALEARRAKARRDDAELDAVERELRELDEAIARGFGDLSDEDRRTLSARCDGPLPG